MSYTAKCACGCQSDGQGKRSKATHKLNCELSYSTGCQCARRMNADKGEKMPAGKWSYPARRIYLRLLLNCIGRSGGDISKCAHSRCLSLWPTVTVMCRGGQHASGILQCTDSQVSGWKLPCIGGRWLFLPDDVSNTSKACCTPAGTKHRKSQWIFCHIGRCVD